MSRAPHADGRRADAMRLRRRLRVSSFAITSTSPMRGMFVSTHSSVVSRHAASSGSAAFLLPSTSIVPEIGRPPSISRLDIKNLPGRRSLPATSTPNRSLTRARHKSIRLRMSAAVARPSLTMKLPWVGDTRASPRDAPFSPARSTSAPADAGMSAGTSAAIGILKNAAGARRIERLRPLSVRERLARDVAKRRRIAGRHAEHGRQQHFAGFLQAASIVPEFHFVARKIARRSVAARPAAPTRPARRSAGRRNARCRKSRRRRCPACRPTLRGPAMPAVDRPAHQPVDGRRPRRRGHVRRSICSMLAAPRPDDEAADAAVADQHIRSAAEQRDADAARMRNPKRIDDFVGGSSSRAAIRRARRP